MNPDLPSYSLTGYQLSRPDWIILLKSVTHGMRTMEMTVGMSLTSSMPRLLFVIVGKGSILYSILFPSNILSNSTKDNF